MQTDSLNMSFLEEIESYLNRSGKTPAELGREAGVAADFIAEVRKGRSPRLDTADRVRTHIRREMAALDAADRARADFDAARTNCQSGIAANG